MSSQSSIIETNGRTFHEAVKRHRTGKTAVGILGLVEVYFVRFGPGKIRHRWWENNQYLNQSVRKDWSGQCAEYISPHNDSATNVSPCMDIRNEADSSSKTLFLTNWKGWNNCHRIKQEDATEIVRGKVGSVYRGQKPEPKFSWDHNRKLCVFWNWSSQLWSRKPPYINTSGWKHCSTRPVDLSSGGACDQLADQTKFDSSVGRHKRIHLSR